MKSLTVKRILIAAISLTTSTALAQGYGERFNLTIDQLEKLPRCSTICSQWRNLDEGGSPAADAYFNLLQADCGDLLPILLESDFWCPVRGRLRINSEVICKENPFNQWLLPIRY